MSFEENFLYPLYLLLIGGGVTGILIPFFNRLHESKLKRLEHEHEESQKRIDRDREDYKFELKIKSEILEKLTELTSRIYRDLVILKQRRGENTGEFVDEYLNYLVKQESSIKDFLVLYFNSNEELFEIWTKISLMCASAAEICDSKSNSPEREKALKKSSKQFNITLDEKVFDSNLKSDVMFPKHVVELFNEIRNFKLKIKKTKMS